jgi:hypothetical protein
MAHGAFIEPNQALECLANPAEALGIQIHSGFRAAKHARHLKGQNRIFDQIVARLSKLDLPYEDQCSTEYYFDLVRTLRDFNGEFDRLVEVGVFMGGSSGIFAGCIGPFDVDLDMVDISADYLQFAYERVRRMYPESTDRIRLFHGDLPSYVRAVMLEEPVRTIVHHDGAHDFNQVVRDMAALSFVREQLVAIIAQDTHLRGTVHHMNFVDMAMYAVFGLDLNYAPIGKRYPEMDSRTAPNKYQGNYFMPDAAEGFVLPMALNEFLYPHPDLSIDDFLPTPTLKLVAAAS